MPKDKAGNYHMQPHKARMADRAAIASHGPEHPSPEPMGGSESSTLHIPGDGSSSTESSDGETMDHPTVAHGILHLAKKHGAEADLKHMVSGAQKPTMSEGIPNDNKPMSGISGI